MVWGLNFSAAETDIQFVDLKSWICVDKICTLMYCTDESKRRSARGAEYIQGGIRIWE